MESIEDYKKEVELWKAKFDFLEAMYKACGESSAAQVKALNEEITALKKEKRSLNLKLTMRDKKVDKLTEENKKLSKENRKVINDNHDLFYKLYGQPTED